MWPKAITTSGLCIPPRPSRARHWRITRKQWQSFSGNSGKPSLRGHILLQHRDVRHHMGEYDKALENLQKVLSIMLKQMGPSHPYVARGYNYIGEAHNAKGENGKAFVFFKKHSPYSSSSRGRKTRIWPVATTTSGWYILPGWISPRPRSIWGSLMLFGSRSWAPTILMPRKQRTNWTR